MAEFASKGVAGAGLGTGIAGLSLGVLNSGLFNGLLGGCNGGWSGGNYGGNCGDNYFINRYEAGQSARIAELETEVKLRDANFYTLGEMGKLRDYVDHKFDCINAQFGNQGVFNAQVASNLSCMQGNISTLMGLTKTVVPITSICPSPMLQYNSWVAPTATAATPEAGA